MARTWAILLVVLVAAGPLAGADLTPIGGGTFTRDSSAYLGTPTDMLSYPNNEPRFGTVLACGASDGAVIYGEANGKDLYPLNCNSRYIFGYSRDKARMYRSPDGATWSTCGPANYSDDPFTLIVIPSGPNQDRIIRFMKFAGHCSPYWSDDDGNTWNIGKDSADPDDPFYCAGDPYDPPGTSFRNWGHQYSPGGILIVAQYGSYVYRSRDDGVTWEKVFQQPVLITGPVQSASWNTVQLDSAASSINDYYKNRFIKITAGAGTGQTSLEIIAYDGATQTATIAGSWSPMPQGPGGGNPSTYSIPVFLHIHALGYHPGIGPLGRWIFNTGDRTINQHCYVSDDNGDTWADYLPGKIAPDCQTVGYLYDGHPTRLLLASDVQLQVGWIDLVTWEVGVYPVNWGPAYCWQIFKHDGLYYAITGSSASQPVIAVSRSLEDWAAYYRLVGPSGCFFDHFCGYVGGKLHFMTYYGSVYKHLAVSPPQVVEKPGLALAPPSVNYLDPAVSQGESTAGITFRNTDVPNLDFETKQAGTASLHLHGIDGAYPKLYMLFTNTAGTTKTFQASLWAKCRGQDLWTQWSSGISYNLGASPDEWREYVSLPATIASGASQTLYIGTTPSNANNSSEAWVDSLQIQETPSTDWQLGGNPRAAEVLDRPVTFPENWTHIFTVRTRNFSNYLPAGHSYLMSYLADASNFAEVYWDGSDKRFKLQVTENGIPDQPIATQSGGWFIPQACIKVAVRRSGGAFRLSVANGGLFEHVPGSAPDSATRPVVGPGTIRTGKSDGSAMMPYVLIDSSCRDYAMSDSDLNAIAPQPVDPNPVAPPQITQQAQSQVFCPGDTVVLSIIASGGGTLSYQWQKNGSNLTDGGHYFGVTLPTLTVTSADTGDAGDYRCAVSNVSGTATSDAATLTFNAQSATYVTQQPQSQYNVVPGSTVTFSVTGMGVGDLTYQWQNKGVNLTNDDHISGANSNNLQITNVDVADAGVYRCVVTAGCGSCTSNEATLTIGPPPLFADLDNDGDVDQDDMTIFDHCFTGPAVPYDPQNLPPGCALTPDANGKIPADFDKDGDVDQEDFAVFQRCYSGSGNPADPYCSL